ncbi:hypothetical protein [Microbacterium sp. CH12i]|uniref:hypothetical protein n=1 Tax=Microbacterium sp. CH12i TaxID=1479651 RepID=UPI000A4C7575|nr:hypothetical protein [Microbacterium sp. CH12i]
MSAPVATSPRRERRRGSRATFTSVLGELLLTAGVIVLLFVAWQMWIGDLIISAQSNSQGQEITHKWEQRRYPTCHLSWPTRTPVRPGTSRLC